MKKHLFHLFLISFVFISCSGDDDGKQATTSLTINFSHNWDGNPIIIDNTLNYTNAHGTQLSIERLRYLISNVTLSQPGLNDIVLSGYNLVDVGNNTGLSYLPSSTVPAGTYNLSFTFGFNNNDNISGAYTDLNSANFNVPDMMGGGYHYMQMDGKFMNNSNVETGYNFHAIRAVDNPGMNPTFPQDTFFTVDLGTIILTDDSTIEVKANIAEWFKNPNTWDLNSLHQMLMPNSNAQVMMYQNGQNVFSLAQ